MARRRLQWFRNSLCPAALVVVLCLMQSVPSRAPTTSTTSTSTSSTSTSTSSTSTSTSTTSSTLTTNVNAVAGVVVDANGVLRTEMFPDLTGQLARQRIAAAKAALAAADPGVVKP